MQNNVSLKVLCLAMVFMGCISNAQAQVPAVAVTDAQQSAIKNYKVNAIKCLASLTLAVINVSAGIAISEVANPGVIKRVTGGGPFDGQEALPVLVGIVTGGYCAYKAPQWVNAYISDFKK